MGPSRELLDAEGLEQRLRELAEIADGWSVEGDRLTKTFRFDAYKSGLEFAVAIGYLADELDHHPELTIGYKTLRVAVNTHTAAGVTDMDFALANAIERMKRLQSQ